MCPNWEISPEVKEMLTKVTQEDPVFPDPLTTKDGVAIVRLRKVEAAANELFER